MPRGSFRKFIVMTNRKPKLNKNKEELSNKDNNSEPKHIGEYVGKLMEEANLNPTSLGRRINKAANTVKDILERESIDSELLLAISNAVNKNAFAYYDGKEPIASIKKREHEKHTEEIKRLNTESDQYKREVTFQDARINELLLRIAEQEENIRLLKEKEILIDEIIKTKK